MIQSEMKASLKSSAKRTMFLQPQRPMEPGAVYDQDGMMNGISCEDRFFNFDAITENAFEIPDPALVNIIVPYEYEANIAQGANVDDAIKDVERRIFLDVAATTPLYSMDDSGGEITRMNCDKLLATALNLPFADGLRLRGRHLQNDDSEWKNFLGIRASPTDVRSENGTCKRTIENDPDTTCYPINAYVTAQVPVVQELGPDVIRMTVLQHVKTSMDDNVYTTDEIPRLTFIGIRNDENDGIDINRDGVLNTQPESEPIDDTTMSPLGISLAAGLSLAVLFAGLICGVRVRKQHKSSDRQFAKLQDDPVVLDCNGDGDHESDLSPRPLERSVFTQASPDSVEVIDIDGNKGSRWTSCGGEFSIGEFMDKLRGKDDSISLESEGEQKSIAEDSALSVQTEEYGK